MQITIDTEKESPVSLKKIARFLESLAESSSNPDPIDYATPVSTSNDSSDSDKDSDDFMPMSIFPY